MKYYFTKFGVELSSCLRTEELKRFFNSDRVLFGFVEGLLGFRNCGGQCKAFPSWSSTLGNPLLL